ncbi:MAG: hypothetical protein HYR94_28995 [Chloroflexi bacterium]|nr:hypothetical protein [Chloroflexota bacterium]
MRQEQSKLQQQINWYFSLLVLFLFVTVPPILCSLLYLSQVPEVMWQRDDHLTFDRVWMYRERRPLGIAYQTQRVTQEYSQTEVCVQSDLQFFLWGSSNLAKPATSSRRMVLVDNQWQSTGEACR